MFKHPLLKRVKQLEKFLQVEDYTFHFEDGSSIQTSENQFRKIWGDIHKKQHNPIYEQLKEKLNQGFPDDAGLIYLMQAEDPRENLDLWD